MIIIIIIIIMVIIIIIIIILRLTIRLNTTNITLCKSQFVGHLSFFFPKSWQCLWWGRAVRWGLKCPGGWARLELSHDGSVWYDFFCPIDTRAPDQSWLRHSERKRKCRNLYQEQKREIRCIWKLRETTVVPVVSGALGTISRVVIE